VASALASLRELAGDVRVERLGVVGGAALEIGTPAGSLSVPVEELRAAYEGGLPDRLS